MEKISKFVLASASAVLLAGCNNAATDTTDDKVCCESFGYGSEMVKCCEEYAWILESECKVEDGLDGGGKQVVENSFCNEDIAKTKTENIISEQEIFDAQKIWGDGIIKIGEAYSHKDDYKIIASNHIDELYGYNMGTVLFKPTLAYQKQFRTDKEGALSYFVGDNLNYLEDSGFAIKPWSNVRWENTGITIIDNTAVTMGNYYFTPSEGGDEVKVEYSFAYTKDKDGKLRIILHDSHFPYTPNVSAE